MNKNLMFPQAGILTSLALDGNMAKVYLPLFKLETGWIRLSTNLLFEKSIKLKTLVITTGTIDRSGDTSISYSQIQGESGTIDELSWDTLKIGDEVLVLFVNGDINMGVVTNRLG